MIDTFLAAASFGLGLGGFLATLWTLPPSRRSSRYAVIILACLSAFVAVEAAFLWRQQEAVRHRHTLSQRLLGMLNSEGRTLDQLHEELPFEDFNVVSNVVFELVYLDKVGRRSIGVTDSAGLRYKVAVYFSKSP